MTPIPPCSNEALVELLKVLASCDTDGEGVWPRVTEDGDVAILINCNDLFYWACGDAEYFTENDVALLQGAADDLRAAGEFGEVYLLELFCCRKRGMRPHYTRWVAEQNRPPQLTHASKSTPRQPPLHSGDQDERRSTHLTQRHLAKLYRLPLRQGAPTRGQVPNHATKHRARHYRQLHSHKQRRNTPQAQPQAGIDTPGHLREPKNATFLLPNHRF